MSFSFGSAAQSLSEDASIAIETIPADGYMGLGGGLGKAIAQPTVVKAAPPPVVQAVVKPVVAVPQRQRQARPSRVTARATSEVTPTVLIARQLDATGLNISSIGTPERVP